METRNPIYAGLVALVLAGCDSKSANNSSSKTIPTSQNSSASDNNPAPKFDPRYNPKAAEFFASYNPTRFKYDKKKMAKNMEELLRYVAKYHEDEKSSAHLFNDVLKVFASTYLKEKVYKFSYEIPSSVTGFVFSDGEIKVFDSQGKEYADAKTRVFTMELAANLVEKELLFYRQRERHK